MAVSKLNPVSGGKTRRLLTLTSGTSWTVPAGVDFVNVTLQGGGGAGAYIQSYGLPGQLISSNLSVTPGASIAYAIGGGGGGTGGDGGSGGTTTFTGATSAGGGGGGSSSGGVPKAGTNAGWYNGGGANGGTSGANGGSGGSGRIDIEYWV